MAAFLPTGRSARGEPGLEHSCTDRVPAALDVLPQDIPAMPGDAATAGKELQAGLESGAAAQTSLGKGSGELSRPRESAFSTQICSSIRGAQPRGIFAQMHCEGENLLLSLSTDQLPGQVRAVTITLQLLP